MANKKKCLVFETLAKVSDMEIMESASDGAVRLHGVFGVCGVKNGNNRIYSKENYGKMVENLQKVIVKEGCLGELEHPNTMNIDLNNVSHMIESIEMDDNGTITGTIKLLDTVKGKNAKAIVEAGCPLFISSRGSGSIDEAGNVTLSTIKTYDLVGTPGFAQAKLTLKENQTCESLNENLMIIVEGEDDLLDNNEDDDKKKDDENKEDNKEDKEKKEEENKEEEPKKEENKEDNKDNNNDNVTMEDIKTSIDKLSEKVTALEAELHVAQESLANVKSVDYAAIEKWVNEEFAPNFTEEILENVDERVEESKVNIATGIEKWVSEEFTPNLERWINEEYSASLEQWISEEYTGQVEKWINEEYTSQVEKWITEEYTGQVEKWINEEYSASLEQWISEEYTGQVEKWINEEYSQTLHNWINEELIPEQNQNINEFIESQKEDRLSQIDKMLESIDSIGGVSPVQQIIEQQNEQNKYKGVYVVENMPSQYQPLWAGISEAKQNEIIRMSRIYDFTKAGVLENFWANIDFNEAPIVENKNVQPEDGRSNYMNSIINRMNTLRGVAF